jgi:hypothetical protein
MMIVSCALTDGEFYIIKKLKIEIALIFSSFYSSINLYPLSKTRAELISRMHIFKGKYDFSDITKAHTAIKKDYGDIVRFSGMEPRRDMVMVYTAEDIETIFRHEGIWPERPSLRSMNYYRTVARKEFFKGVGGILNE